MTDTNSITLEDAMSVAQAQQKEILGLRLVIASLQRERATLAAELAAKGRIAGA